MFRRMRPLLLVLIGVFSAHCGDDQNGGDGGADASVDFAEPRDASLDDLAAPHDLAQPGDLSGGGCPATGPTKICVHGSVRRIIDDSLLGSSDQVLVQLFDPL